MGLGRLLQNFFQLLNSVLPYVSSYPLPPPHTPPKSLPAFPLLFRVVQ